jgi:hypothetical protein
LAWWLLGAYWIGRLRGCSPYMKVSNLYEVTNSHLNGRGNMRLSQVPSDRTVTRVVLTLKNTHARLSGRTIFSPRGTSISCTLVNLNQPLASANAPTSTDMLKSYQKVRKIILYRNFTEIACFFVKDCMDNTTYG